MTLGLLCFGSPVVAVQMAEADTTPTAINLVFIGNSITEGATLPNPSTQAPPFRVRSLVEKATGISTYVHNGGHGGYTTFGFLPDRTDFLQVCAAAEQLVAEHEGPLYFSIMLGTNDSSNDPRCEGAPVSHATYTANMKAIIEAIISRFPQCKILINFPLWYSPNFNTGPGYIGLEHLHSFYPLIDDLVTHYEQVYAGDRSVWDFFEDNKALFTSETWGITLFVHPNLTGATRLAEIWTRSLLDIMATDGIETKKPLTEWNVFRPQNNRKYAINTARGYYSTADGFLANTVRSSLGASRGEFAFITYSDKLYLYSIAEGKFIYRDPEPYRDTWCNVILSNDIIEPIKVNYTGMNANYPYYLTSQGYVFNVASSMEKGVCLSEYTNCDASNQTAIRDIGEFDPTEALGILDRHFNFTRINSPSPDDMETGVWYDLSGRRISVSSGTSVLPKGVYINDRQREKILVK